MKYSQPTVSLHIRRLEECFNAVLIRRSKNKNSLA
ncbi:MAG: LysR family transcriptional regulator [Phascolarctobacterium faecium]